MNAVRGAPTRERTKTLNYIVQHKPDSSSTSDKIPIDMLKRLKSSTKNSESQLKTGQ